MSVAPPVLKKGALASACVVGVWVAIKLMEQFSSALKPLVLATMLVGCLEYFVQLFEMLFIRCGQLLQYVLRLAVYKARSRTGSDFREGLLQGPNSDLPRPTMSSWSNDEAGRVFLARLFAVAITLWLFVLALLFLTQLLVSSLRNLDMNIYKEGFIELRNQTVTIIQKTYPNLANDAQSKLDDAQDMIESLLVNTLHGLVMKSSNFVTETVMFLLYAIMWLLRPLAANQQIFEIVRTYFMMKAVCNLVYAGLVLMLLTWLDVDLAVVITLICFCLGFIPEVGTFVALLLPLPVVLLDARLRVMMRLVKMAKVLVGMLGIKFAVANGLESVVMGSNPTLAGVKDQSSEFEETHPVIVLFIVVVLGNLWGVTGMLVSVPLIAMVRLLINLESMERRPSARDMAHAE